MHSLAGQAFAGVLEKVGRCADPKKKVKTLVWLVAGFYSDSILITDRLIGIAQQPLPGPWACSCSCSCRRRRVSYRIVPGCYRLLAVFLARSLAHRSHSSVPPSSLALTHSLTLTLISRSDTPLLASQPFLPYSEPYQGLPPPSAHAPSPSPSPPPPASLLSHPPHPLSDSYTPSPPPCPHPTTESRSASSDLATGAYPFTPSLS